MWMMRLMILCRNWSSTMFAAVLFIAAVYYLIKGRHEYDGPVLLVKRNTE